MDRIRIRGGRQLKGQIRLQRPLDGRHGDETVGLDPHHDLRIGGGELGGGGGAVAQPGAQGVRRDQQVGGGQIQGGGQLPVPRFPIVLAGEVSQRRGIRLTAQNILQGANKIIRAFT